jgi:hypothetical protein
MSENVSTKARRLLTEGRVRILEAHEDDGVVSAAVRGDSGRVYTTSYDASGWFCTCSARGRCSHVQAVQLVVVVEPREAAA